jgi:hypothetical protein
VYILMLALAMSWSGSWASESFSIRLIVQPEEGIKHAFKGKEVWLSRERIGIEDISFKKIESLEGQTIYIKLTRSMKVIFGANKIERIAVVVNDEIITAPKLLLDVEHELTISVFEANVFKELCRSLSIEEGI